MNTEQHYYESIYHLAHISAMKLNNASTTRTEPTLRRQLLVRNVLIVSSNIIVTSQSVQEEQGWLDACFDELDQDEDSFMEEQEQEKKDNLLVMAIPFEFYPKNQ